MDNSYWNSELNRIGLGYEDQGPCSSFVADERHGVVRIYEDHGDIYLLESDAKELFSNLPDGFLVDPGEGLEDAYNVLDLQSSDREKLEAVYMEGEW